MYVFMKKVTIKAILCLPNLPIDSSKPLSSLTLCLKPGIFFVSQSHLFRDVDLYSVGLPTRCITLSSVKKLQRWFFYHPPLLFAYSLQHSTNKKNKAYEQKKIKSL